MGPKRVFLRKLDRDLPRHILVKAARDGNSGQLVQFCGRRLGQFLGLTCKIGLFRVGLRADRDILACCHGHGPGNQTCQSGDQDFGLSGPCRRNTHYQTCGRHKAIVGAQHSGRSQPMRCTMWV